MIDDFWFTDCKCPECDAARKAKTATIGERTFPVASDSWDDYRSELLVRLSQQRILAPARRANPKVKVIIKYPQWYDHFHERGYDVVRETVDFERIWVGTETRDYTDARWGGTVQYEAYFIMRWLGGIGGQKCGGGWFDSVLFPRRISTVIEHQISHQSSRFLLSYAFPSPFEGGLPMKARSIAAAILVLTCAVPVAAAEVQPPGSGKKHPAEEAGIKSLDSRVETSIRFRNNMSQTVKVFWIDTEGKRILKATLKPLDQSEQKTCLTHPWLITDERDNALSLYFPDAQVRTIMLGTRSQTRLWDRRMVRANQYRIDHGTCSRSTFIADKAYEVELGLTPEQIGRIAELSTGNDTALKEILTPTQLKRYQGIYVQRTMIGYGPKGPFLYREVVELLNLTGEQKQKILAIGQEDSRAVAMLAGVEGWLSEDKLQAIEKQTEAKLAEVLNAEQEARLTEFLGAPFTAAPARTLSLQSPKD